MGTGLGRHLDEQPNLDNLPDKLNVEEGTLVYASESLVLSSITLVLKSITRSQEPPTRLRSIRPPRGPRGNLPYKLGEMVGKGRLWVEP